MDTPAALQKSKKTYDPEVTRQLSILGTHLRNMWRASKKDLRGFAKECNLSVNSVKSIFNGQTANIANYLTVMKVLGTDLEDLVPKLPWSEGKNPTTFPVQAKTSLF